MYINFSLNSGNFLLAPSHKSNNKQLFDPSSCIQSNVLLIAQDLQNKIHLLLFLTIEFPDNAKAQKIVLCVCVCDLALIIFIYFKAS